ncbi:MAG: TonB-dependent receptor [Gemmatimonadaceae bacterium]
MTASSVFAARSARVERVARRILQIGLVVGLCAARRADAQASGGTFRGRVVDQAGVGIVGASIHLNGTTLGASSDGRGNYTVLRVRAATYVAVFRHTGFAPDSFTVTIRAGDTVVQDVTMRPSTQELERVVISASPRLNETIEQGLSKQKGADNIVAILSGDVIRALPNANAAEAAARIPGVSTERDEGEGKFVEIRGTEPRLSNVTVNGVHIPGTQGGDRIAKLDDVPTDILGAIEVTKTLTADQDADAIGGSVNLVTKVPEGAPRGYVAFQAGQSTLESRGQSQGNAMWGGRFGEQRKLGLLFGGTWDHNSRGINDVELSWDVNDKNTPIPVEWDQRDYLYDRTRWGGNAALDYRFDDGSTMFLRGMISKFKNFGVVYKYDIAGGGDSTQASSGAAGIGTGATMTRNTSNRVPREQLFSVNGGGKKMLGGVDVSYVADYSGTRSSSADGNSSAFTYAGPDYRYDGANHNYPSYSYLSSADQAAANNPANYKFASASIGGGTTRGDEVGGQLDALKHYKLGDDDAQLKVGAKYRDETRDNANHNRNFTAATPFSLAQVLGTFSDPNFYQDLAKGFAIGPEADHGELIRFEGANPTMLTETTKPISDSLGNFNGGEKVASLYAMHTLDHGPFRLNLGLRAEHTAVDFSGNVASTPASTPGKPTGAQTVHRVTATQDYTDLFPSAQMRWALDDDSNLRLAVTRGIARANYSDLAPHVSGQICSTCALKFSNLSVGNPDLKPQHAWNVDLLGERYFGSTGVFSAGVFYKQITDFIYKRQFIYQGPATEFDGYYATAPANGGDAHLIGGEFDVSRRLDFIPGLPRELGFDVNWTQVYSHAAVSKDTATTAATLGSPIVRYARLPRQSNSLGNFALTYDSRRVSARAAWQYQGESIDSYGDGSATPDGDSWFLPHSQLDASVSVELRQDIAIQILGLDLNNAVFGFYNGNSQAQYSAQREYYGRSVILSVKYAFGALPGTR